MKRAKTSSGEKTVGSVNDERKEMKRSKNGGKCT
mgnify:CR=1 FL=1